MLALFLTLAGLSGCASSSADTSGIKGVEVDAVLPSNNSWYAFQFGSLRYLHLSGENETWKQIASPGGAFRPIEAVTGIHGHFYLVDAAQGRLCLYDTAAQLISVFPLPPAVLPIAPGRISVFRAADGAFTFMDYMNGEANQFADRQGSEGGTDWVLRNRARLPMGIRNCVQEPESPGIACALADGFIRLDASLNRTGSNARPATTPGGKARLIWDVDALEWVLQASARDSEKPLFRFWANQRRLETVPPLSP